MENLPPQVLRLVYKEVSALAADPPEGIKVYPSEEDITELHTSIEGPGKTGSVRPQKLSFVCFCTMKKYLIFLFLYTSFHSVTALPIKNKINLFPNKSFTVVIF